MVLVSDIKADKDRYYTLILAKRPRSDGDQVFEWMDLDFQPFSGSLVAQTPNTKIPSSESLFHTFPPLWVWVQAVRVAKWLKCIWSSILNYPRKSEFRSANCHQRPLLSSKENINNVLGRGNGVSGWNRQRKFRWSHIQMANTDLNQHCFTSWYDEN